MNVDNEKIKSIIVKSVLGTLTEEENFVLEGWLQENDRNKVLYQKLSSAVELKYKYEQYEGVDDALPIWRLSGEINVVCVKMFRTG